MVDRTNVISGGSTGVIELLPCGNVRKSAYPDGGTRKQSLRDIEREFEIYQRLPQHDRLLRMISYSPQDGLILEYMPGGNLRERLRDEEAPAGITVTQRLQWACDAAEALQVLHSHDIIHCDVKPENYLLDFASRLRIIDFSGSSIDGKWASAFEGIRFCLPRPWEEQPTVVTDLFALGSTIYEIMTGKEPYDDIPDEEVETRYKKQIFPTVETVACGEVVKGCWRGEIKSANEAMVLIKAEMAITK